ncbi:M6 family metalloprotease domain-containing protein [Solirubrobacter soli]|uniref:M6 family metalloprotease domain-containing protein n=1 Tax=Solirubrobacter soli TaxID=363832 RepID=UPI00040CD2AA|nr:M6 family metalloprotease domain-containing protein [Solirubrobacter soli]
MAVASLGVAAGASAAPPAPLDPQNWSFQDNLTWADYKKLPGPDYSDPSIQPTVKKWKIALILVDYDDREFTISQPAGGTVFGTPTALANSVPRAQVPQFYADFLNKPQPLNNFQTMNRYWMEDSFGKYGVEVVPFGPYRMPLKSYQYHIANFQNTTADCPSPGNATPNPTPCNQNFFNAARNAWLADIDAPGNPYEAAQFDNMFWTSAGQDESGAWQEFGEMRFTGPEAVTDPFGPKHINPLHARGNWATTRYIPWTSWAAAANVWPSASGNSSTEAESAGMAVYAHELSHNLGIPDNYNNPFSAPFQRTASGMWDMMSRGSFNGPGGQHTRFMIPPTQGSALGAQHNMRNKRFLNFITDGDLLRLNRNGLAQSGLAVAEVKAREVQPNGALAGVRINLDGEGDLNKVCLTSQAGIDPTCEGPWRSSPTAAIQGRFNDYTMEVVQQIGSDSFSPGHGVLIGKSKTGSSTCGSYSCFVWYIDSNPQDIDQVDFVRADGTPIKATSGDERQLNDGSFNVGVNSGGEYEYVATDNKLHFYILDKRTDADGILHYKVGVRSTAGAGPQTRGVSVGAASRGTAEGYSTCTFPVKNTGAAAATDPTLHPQDANAYLTSDIYRLTASANGTGWTAHLKNALAAVKFGETVDVPVYIEKAAGAAASGSVTLNATSESDPSKSMSVSCSFGAGDTVGGTVPATLALTMGAPASFGAFTPGLQKDYFASTTATVVSSAGDATLSVADPSTNAPGRLVNGTFSLPEALQAAGSTSGTYAPLPTTLKTYGGPASNDVVNVSFKQPVKASDPLRTGTYSKTLTFTLSTTTP